MTPNPLPSPYPDSAAAVGEADQAHLARLNYTLVAQRLYARRQADNSYKAREHRQAALWHQIAEEITDYLGDRTQDWLIDAFEDVLVVGPAKDVLVAGATEVARPPP